MHQTYRNIKSTKDTTHTKYKTCEIQDTQNTCTKMQNEKYAAYKIHEILNTKYIRYNMQNIHNMHRIRKIPKQNAKYKIPQTRGTTKGFSRLIMVMTVTSLSGSCPVHETIASRQGTTTFGSQNVVLPAEWRCV